MAVKHCEFELINGGECNTDLSNSMLSMCMPHFILCHQEDEDMHELATCVFPVFRDGDWQRCGADQAQYSLCCPEHMPMCGVEMVPQCKFTKIGNHKCLGECRLNSNYCTHHFMAESDYDGKGCVIGTFDIDDEIQRCGQSCWHPESHYCKAHAKLGADEGLGKPEGCQYILTRGSKQGQQCGLACEGQVCKMHDPNMIVKKVSLIGNHPAFIKKC